MAPSLFRKLLPKAKKDPASKAASSSSEPAPQDLFRSRGDDRAQNGDYNGAAMMYDEALRYSPTDPTLLLSRSLAYMMSNPPKLDLALQDADAAIQHNPANWEGWAQKGETCLRMGDLEGADQALRNAVGFAQGMNKLTAQRSLADVQSRRDRTSFPVNYPSASIPAPSSPARPNISPTTMPSLTPPVTLTPPTTIPARAPSVSVPPFSSNRQASGGAPFTANEPRPSPTVPRATETSARSQAPLSNPPSSPEDLPPRYVPNVTSPDPAVRTLSQQELTTQLTQLQTTLASRNKGSLSIKPYTSSGTIDAVMLVYVGMTQLELTGRELGTPTYLHPTFRNMAVDILSYPGSTFLDMDCESSGYYEGKLPGTVSISGYSEEYREDQLLKVPLLNLALEGTNTLSVMTLDKIITRLRLLQQLSTLEDNEILREILGLSQLSSLQSGLYSGGNTQRQIEALCMALNRSLYAAPNRFIDLSKARNFSNNTLGTLTQGIGLRNFLFQILVGAELLIRLRKEPVTTSYVGLITDATSALMVVSDLWMQNVTIQDAGATATTSATSDSTTNTNNLSSPRYKLIATQHQLQAEGLIRFGEALSWPYMDEARHYIENAYQELISSKSVANFDICDWLYGLVLPGKIFRHRIMCCLVYASPSIRSINPAPFWDNGLVVKNQSYWPKRSVLGRVLGGLKNPKCVCGWIGPLPSPEGNFSGWIRLNARRVDIPVPISPAQPTLQSLGFGESDGTETPGDILQSITDQNEWIQGSSPSRSVNDLSSSVFKSIHLTETLSTAATTTGANSTNKEYTASLNFEVNGTPTRYTLYSNPIFVSAPPCVGTHTMHRRQAQNFLKTVVKVADLKEAYPPSDSLVIIDALGQGEEAVARAWCAERGKHAVIRRDGECCFACATAVAVGGTGLGFNVLIWSR